MSKRFLKLLMVFLILASTSITVSAHERGEHDKDIERVLFGDPNYKDRNSNVAEIISAIEDATYLCVDQYNGNGEVELKNLRSRKIPGLPKTIKDIDFSGNYAHRNFTHRGWNVLYDAKAHWDERQKILINTVDKELFSEVKNSSNFISNLINKKKIESQYKKQIESFAVLLYYIHILGDHIEAEKYNQLSYVAPLANLDERDNQGVIPDLIKYSDFLFESQKSTRVYRSFIEDLEELQDISNALYTSKGGVNTDEEFEQYHKCATDLLTVLESNIPRLLKQEEFFSTTFYK